ncbi:MAG TPA: polyprenyl synthetase family protein, partial [Clostridia bacterium]|nr:polyprenyl synthetase family protein [Clostridia bacterium]
MTYNQTYEEDRLLVDKRLERIFDGFSDVPRILLDAMNYSLLCGGKRLRPVLMIETAKMFGQKYEDVLDLACAVEMIHTYSLIHDDLPGMDDDDMRRGRQSNHIVF